MGEFCRLTGRCKKSSCLEIPIRIEPARREVRRGDVRANAGFCAGSLRPQAGESCVLVQKGERSPIAVGMEWASTITTIGLLYTLPIVLGYYLDRYWGTSPAATLTGVVSGLAVGMVYTVRLGRSLPGGPKRHPESRQKGDPRVMPPDEPRRD
jgi:F0F1-type ATP synthase assembly protein I